MAGFRRFILSLPLLLLSPLLLLASLVALLVCDALWRLFGTRMPRKDLRPDTSAATVVIPNWNGKDLLEKYLPTVLAATAGNPRNEVIVVDNGSTDGSRELLAGRFPEVKVVALEHNLGFGGGSNAGFAAARNDIVVLLNNDMRVEPDLLPPLLEGFAHESVFAVSCQIHFSDPQRVREETGLTQGWWEAGGLRVRHRIDDHIQSAYPCFYGGGGSCAFDRAKFLELGGFDPLLAPFYLEDTDLGFMAWKRGWKVLYEPRSVVWHEHRGTIGRRFTPSYIQSVLKKNFLLFVWKNIHGWPRLAAHFAWTWAGAVVSVLLGDSPERPNLAGIWRAFVQLPRAVRSRTSALRMAEIDDQEAFARPMGGWFRDFFETLPAQPDVLNVLFVSPYPICPPVHGGGVFMYQTIRELARLCRLHLLVLLDHAWEREAHQELEQICASVEYLVRVEGRPKAFASIVPHSVREFANDDLRWAIHRAILFNRIDVLQLEYTNMGQYAGRFRQIPSVLFEHDIYFQSVGRALGRMRGVLRKTAAAFEYLRAIRYELRMLASVDRIQVCSRDNKEHLVGFLPRLTQRIEEGLRAGIDTAHYQFQTTGREPDTMLFLGSFRHVPNQEALDWFVRRVFPLILERRPSARLIVIGSEPPPRHSLPDLPNIEMIGFAEDVLEPLRRYALFVCPIRSGSGVRVKLLEAFAAGIPVVSTRLGAEGLARTDGEVCALADTPGEFATRAVSMLENPEEAAAMAHRAREEVVSNWDMAVITPRLESSYRQAVQEMRSRAISAAR